MTLITDTSISVLVLKLSRLIVHFSSTNIFQKKFCILRGRIENACVASVSIEFSSLKYFLPSVVSLMTNLACHEIHLMRIYSEHIEPNGTITNLCSIYIETERC